MDGTRGQAGAAAATDVRHRAAALAVLLAGLGTGSPAIAQDVPARPGSAAPRPVLLAQAGGPLPTARDIWRHLPELGIEPVPPGEVPASARPPQPPRESPTPAMSPPMTRPVTAPGTPAPKTPAPAASAADSAPRTLEQARLVIHSPSASDAVAGAARRLRDAGTAEVEVRQVPFPVTQRQLRFFYAEDRAIAQRVATVIAPGNPVEIADFTHFRPLPRIGTVELWLP